MCAVTAGTKYLSSLHNDSFYMSCWNLSRSLRNDSVHLSCGTNCFLVKFRKSFGLTFPPLQCRLSIWIQCVYRTVYGLLTPVSVMWRHTQLSLRSSHPVSVMWRHTQLNLRPSHIRLSARSQSSVKQYRTSSDLHFTCVCAYNNKLRVPLHRSVCSRPQTTHGKQ